MDELIKAHDDLLANMPEGASHDKTECPVCNPSVIKDPDERGEVDTFTQEQLDAAVKAALAPLEAKLQTLEEAAAAGEIDALVTAAKAEGDAKASELQDKLDAAELKATNAEQLLADSLAWIQAVVDEGEKAEKAEAVKETRIQILKDQTSFSDEKIAERIDEWAKLSDEAFEERLTEWKELSTAKQVEGEAETAMRVHRKESAGKTSFWDEFKSVTETADAQGVKINL